MPGIGVINNPHSRKNRKNPDWMRSLGFIVGHQGKAVATQKVDDINAMARMYKERNIDILAINGGDGSNSVALTAFIHEYQDQPLPKIALLRGGTMNIAANSCGIKGTPAGLMVNLVHKFREGIPFETTQRDLLKIEGRYGFVMGNGFIHVFLEQLYNSGKKSVFTAAKLLGQSAASSIFHGPWAKKLFAPFLAKITVDGETWPQRRFSAMAAATVEQIGLSFKPFHRCEEQPRTFHLLGVVGSPFRMVGAMPAVYSGRKISEEKIIEQVAHTAVFESEQPIRYTLDGENFSTGNSLTISCGPRLEIIVR